MKNDQYRKFWPSDDSIWTTSSIAIWVVFCTALWRRIQQMQCASVSLLRRFSRNKNAGQVGSNVWVVAPCQKKLNLNKVREVCHHRFEFKEWKCVSGASFTTGIRVVHSQFWQIKHLEGKTVSASDSLSFILNVRSLCIEIHQHLLLSECLNHKRCDPTDLLKMSLVRVQTIDCSWAPALHSELHTNLSKQKTRLIFLIFGTCSPL